MRKCCISFTIWTVCMKWKMCVSRTEKHLSWWSCLTSLPRRSFLTTTLITTSNNFYLTVMITKKTLSLKRMKTLRKYSLTRMLKMDKLNHLRKRVIVRSHREWAKEREKGLREIHLICLDFKRNEWYKWFKWLIVVILYFINIPNL